MDGLEIVFKNDASRRLAEASRQSYLDDGSE